MGATEGGLGEVYARTLMVPEANATFDAAAKADPANAAMYLLNQAVIFFEAKDAAAQVDAANKAIEVDPANAFLYYVKAQGLAADAPFDPGSDKSVLPPDCIAAYRKYLELAPTGPLAAEVTTALERSEEKPSTPAHSTPELTSLFRSNLTSASINSKVGCRRFRSWDLGDRIPPPTQPLGLLQFSRSLATLYNPFHGFCFTQPQNAESRPA